MIETTVEKKQPHLDREQFAALWAKSQRLIAAYIAGAVSSFHDAEDIMQEVALVVARRHADYNPSLPFENWAIGIAKRQIQSYFRKSAVRSPMLLDSALLEQFTKVYESLADDLKLRQELLADCVKQVEGRSREALELCYRRNLRGEEIAQQLGISHSAVRTLLHRVRGALKNCVDRRQHQAVCPAKGRANDDRT